MKRAFLAILAIIYLVATTGATLHLHYCMGKLGNVGILEQESKTCGICGMEKAGDDGNSCCNDEKETVKISIDQKYSSPSVYHFEQPFTDLEAMFTGFQPQLIIVDGDKAPPVSHAPPRSPQVPQYLMYCHLSI